MELYDYFNGYGIEQNLCEKLITLFTYRKYNVGDIILNHGENTKHVCLILEGIVRGYYIDENGNDITKCFSKKGQWCCIYNYFNDKPSEYYIEALEDCNMALINTANLRIIISEYPILRSIYDKLFFEAFTKADYNTTLFQKMSAKQRYLNFSEKNSDIMLRVKQEYIASYLGITPSSLSRIKREL